LASFLMLAMSLMLFRVTAFRYIGVFCMHSPSTTSNSNCDFEPNSSSGQKSFTVLLILDSQLDNLLMRS
jgi:hypothetical protein